MAYQITLINYYTGEFSTVFAKDKTELGRFIRYYENSEALVIYELKSIPNLVDFDDIVQAMKREQDSNDPLFGDHDEHGG